MTDCNFGRPNLLKIKFHEFQEYEPQNKAPQAKLYIRRIGVEVGVGAAHHLGGLLGVDVGCERWIGKMPSVEKVVFPSSGPTLFFTWNRPTVLRSS